MLRNRQLSAARTTDRRHFDESLLFFLILEVSFFPFCWHKRGLRPAKAEWEDAGRSIIWPLQGWALLSFLNIYNILSLFFYDSSHHSVFPFSYLPSVCVCVCVGLPHHKRWKPSPQLNEGPHVVVVVSQRDGRRERDIRFIIAPTRKGDAGISERASLYTQSRW
jgi:hypothetical protein